MTKKGLTKACQDCGQNLSQFATVCTTCDKPQTDNGKPLKVRENYNKYGVSRYIPTDVTAQIRKECGFGCVICGNALCEYEHFEPPFSEIKDEHKAAGIALLCPKDHSKKTDGILSSETIAKARLAPKAKELGFIHETDFFLQGAPSIIHLGPNGMKGQITGCNVVLSANGKPMMWFESDSDAPFGLFNAKFFYADGTRMAVIEQNVLTIKPSEGFDLTTPKSEIIITFNGKCLLHLDRKGSEQLTIVHAELQYGCNNFVVSEEKILLNSNTFRKSLTMRNCPGGIGLICSCGRCTDELD